jgi:hypothetical protein
MRKIIYSQDIGDVDDPNTFEFVPLEFRDYFVFSSEASGVRYRQMKAPTKAYRIIDRSEFEGVKFNTVEIRNEKTLEEIAGKIRNPPRFHQNPLVLKIPYL